MTAIDGTALARELGTIRETATGWSELGGDEPGRRALIRLLGTDVVRSAVRATDDDDERERAIELVRVLADPRSLPHYDAVVRTSTRRGERYWAACGVAELACVGAIERDVEDAWIDRLAHEDDWHVATVAAKVRQLSANERAEGAREAALRDALEAERWTGDPHAIAFLVAHFAARAPDATPADLAARLRTWHEADRAPGDALVALATRPLAIAHGAE